MFLKQARVPSVWILVLLRLSAAQNVGMKSEIGSASVNCALRYDFGCPKVKLPLTCPCRNPNFVTTVFDSIYRHSEDVSDLEKAFHFVKSQCHKWGKTTYTYAEMEKVYNENKDRLIEDSEYNGVLSDSPIRIPDDFFDAQVITAKNTRYHYYIGDCFAWAMVGYWGLVMVCAFITNILRILKPSFFDFLGKKNSLALRKYVTLPALIGSKHLSPWRFLGWNLYFPTRGQFFIILGMFALNIASIVSFLGTKGDTPLLYTSHSDRVLHYLVNRTGIIAFGHVPILVLFACRNNPLIPLTGWTYPTFLCYHRWCARWMAIHAIIHGAAMYWTSFKERVVIFKWKHVYNWVGGNLSAFMVILMLIFALRPFRSRFYEFFKISHQLMFLTFLICLVIHTSDYGWLGWLYTTFVFYGAEYFLRFAKVIAAGGAQNAEFMATDAGVFRVTVKPNNRIWSIQPGYYIYLRVLDKNLFWQSHPFSVYPTYNENDERSILLICKAMNGATKTIYDEVCSTPNGILSKKVLIEGPYGNGNYASEYDSVLLFAGGCGFSAMYNYALHVMRRLKPGQYLCLIWVVRDLSSVRALQSEVDYLHTHHGKTCDFRIFVTRGCEHDILQAKMATMRNANQPDGEDPVATAQNSGEHTGVARPAITVTQHDSTETVVLANKEEPSEDDESIDSAYAAANSIEDHLRSTQTMYSAKSNPYSLRRVNSHSADAPEDNASSRTDITADSRFDCGTEPSTNMEEYESGLIEAYNESGLLRNIRFYRPDIIDEVQDFVKMSQGTKSISCCGPPMFVDNIRESVVESIKKTNERIDYFEDAFSW